MKPLIGELGRRLKHLSQVLTSTERLALGVLTILAFISLFRLISFQKASIVPDFGGTLVEGIVANTASQIQQQLITLDHRGLVALSPDGTVLPSLAKSWEISTDGKEYTFKLADHVDPSIVIDSLKQAHDILGELNIESSSEDTIKIKLAQPFSPLLRNLSSPVINIGPYRLDHTTKNKIYYSANNDFPLKSPFIDSVVIRIANSTQELEHLIKTGEVSMAIDFSTQDNKYDTKKITLGGRPVLIFNNANMSIQKPSIRSKIIKGEKLASPINLTLKVIDLPEMQEIADRVKQRYEQSGIVLNIEKVEPTAMIQNVLPNRDYDLVLINLNDGRDPDPYPFWHSSQIGKDGQNYANYFNKSADKMLEDIRITSDDKKRQDLMNKFTEQLQSDSTVEYFDKNVVDYTISKKVKGVSFQFMETQGDRFSTIENWYIKTKHEIK